MRVAYARLQLLEPARPEALEARGLDSMTGGASNSYADEASEDLWRLPALAVKALENIVKVGTAARPVGPSCAEVDTWSLVPWVWD